MPSSAPATRSALSRARLFMLLAAACLLVAGGYVAWAMVRGAPAAEAVPAASWDGSFAGAETGGQRNVLFRNASDDGFGVVALAARDEPEGERTITALACDRVYFEGGRGLCLAADHSFGSSYSAKIFGADFELLGEVSLGGVPSRARVSSDGRYGAATVFVTGHSYADEGSFSTETTLIDMARGEVIANLEEFEVTRDGDRIESSDFNFWGITFARDSNRFYATLATRGKTYLVEGDVDAREARVLHENVECPSLSPDGTRVAYKKRVGGAGDWRLYVLDLETMEQTALAETRRIDDQAEWLDDRRVLYGLGNDVWVVPADGSGQPRKFLRQATSPAVVG